LVLAIGNPFGVGQTVTSGIVSGLARSGASGAREGKGYFIQTDAPINPGNSGGALIDMAGRLIGVNTSIISRSGGSNGIGFAVPANLVARVIAAAHSGATILERPWLGLQAQRVTAELADALGLDRPEGVLINQVHPESPLAQAGIAAGDVLLAIEGEAVNTPGELSVRAATLGTGRDAEVRYRRRDKAGRAVVALAAAPERPARDQTTLRAPRGLRGLTVMNVNPAVIDQYGLPLSSAGVLVAGVDGPAARSGLRPGDLIYGIDGDPVGTVASLRRKSDRLRDFRLDVERDGRRGTIQIGG
jgi:S1-C subfamily serine protease